jgi:putative CocE/NonD family hydrolase
VESNAEDTDFMAKLMDVYPDGRYILIQDGALRMKFRENDSVALPMEKGTIYNITIDLWTSSYIFPVGHQIAVSVTSSNYPR